MIGTPRVMLYPDPTTTAGAVDITCLLEAADIRHGRPSSSGQPEASTLTMDISVDTGVTPMPAGLEVGSGIRVYVTVPAGQSQRFWGRVTDIAYGWEDMGEETPNSLVAQLHAAGPLADLGRRVVGDVPWTQELDGARVTRILNAAGINPDPVVNDPGTVQILARDVDAQAALELANAVAEDAMGVLWETRDGQVLYADAAHRRGIAVALTLDACDLLVTPTWQRNTDGLVNLASIGYGVAPEGGEQPRYVATSAASQTRYGRYEYTRAPQLVDLPAAQTLGNVLTARNATPAWGFSDLPVDVAGLDPTETWTLLGLDMHSLLYLTGLPVAGNAPTSAYLWVEGWTEHLEAGTHELTLVISDFCRTAPPPRWDDLPPTWTWNTIQPALTWDSAICLGPIAPTTSDRWMDIPASLRWDQVPTTTTWDGWVIPASTETELEAA